MGLKNIHYGLAEKMHMQEKKIQQLEADHMIATAISKAFMKGMVLGVPGDEEFYCDNLLDLIRWYEKDFEVDGQLSFEEVLNNDKING